MSFLISQQTYILSDGFETVYKLTEKQNENPITVRCSDSLNWSCDKCTKHIASAWNECLHIRAAQKK